MRKYLLLVVWPPAVFLCLALSFLVMNSYAKVRDGSKLLEVQAKEMLPKNGYQFYAALPQVLGSFKTAIAKEDARPEILHQFLTRHASPLNEYAETIVAISDTNSIDFRLITSIAMCESNLGKKMPENSYNAWGYAIYSGQKKGAEFKNWDDAIRIMVEYLARTYYSRGLTTPEEIGPIYAPPSVNTDNSWAKCVRKFMDELI